MGQPEQARHATAERMFGHRSRAHAEVRDDVIAIIVRAHRRGFCRPGVAIALEATRYEAAVIEEQIDLE
jgi:hypothetical protein